MKFSGFVALIFSAAAFSNLAGATPPSWRQDYLQRYAFPDVYAKLVNDHGDGFEDLYGVRNFREVIPGLVYRGGANNLYNKNGKRANNNPLPQIGLTNLCEEGFANAVYLYSTNYSKSAHAADCKSGRSNAAHLDYLQKSPLLYKSAVKDILQIVYDTIEGKTAGPVYVHCWNGWHASGFISAVILRQFCGFSGDQAVNYWNKNTDGNNRGKEYDKIRANLRAYTVDPAYAISPETQAQICPRP
jgi:hypothetical protein